MRKFIAALIAAVAAGAAHADCDNPKNDFDDLYCLNKIYIQADKDLNDSYGKLMKKLNNEGRGLLKRGQLDWIKNRNDDCSYRDQRGFFVNLECATNTTIERVQFLDERYRECVSAGCLNSKLR